MTIDREELKRLCAEEKQKEFKPIETAPRDGSLICLKDEAGNEEYCWLSDGDWWVIGKNDGTIFYQPTHWRELDTSPSELAEYARTALPALLEELEAAERERDELREKLRIADIRNAIVENELGVSKLEIERYVEEMDAARVRIAEPEARPQTSDDITVWKDGRGSIVRHKDSDRNMIVVRQLETITVAIVIEADSPGTVRLREFNTADLIQLLPPGAPEDIGSQLLELEQIFDLRWKADMRAIKRWQEATGRMLTWPDSADLSVWLLEKLDAAEARIGELEAKKETA